MDGLIGGRIVHYIISTQRGNPVVRPAMVVRVVNQKKGICNLQVFHEKSDGFELASADKPTNCEFSEEKTTGTWHWPPRG